MIHYKKLGRGVLEILRGRDFICCWCEQGNIYEGIQRNKLAGPLHSKEWRQGYCDFMDY